MQKVKKNYFSLFFWFILSVTIGGLYFVFNINTFIKKGIDLVGGSYVSLRVGMDSIYQEIFFETKKKLLEVLEEKPSSITIDKDDMILFYTSEETLKKSYQEIKAMKLDYEITLEKDHKICMAISESNRERMTDEAIATNIKTLRKRLDPFGAGELMIARQGQNIILEIPSVYDGDHIKRLIGKTARLEMRRVIDIASTKQELLKKYSHMGDYVSIFEDKGGTYWYALAKEVLLTGSLLKKAYVGYNQERGNTPVVTIEFNSIGAKKFYEVTKKNIDKCIAITIDNNVVTAPRVNDAIPNGIASIESKQFSVEEAQELVLMLESGSFAAPVFYDQERVIAPILGIKTIENGIFACLIGIILLFIFSLIYYKASGFFAFLVLVYNLLFTLIGMSLIGATLTLSGIAGLVLTLGMAIDSSVLLFEKIKEEMTLGKTFSEGVSTAFSKGISVILDANITHFLISLVLYYVGAGPLKGFAITMLIGIVSTLVTGIFFLKSFIKYAIMCKNNQSLSI